MKKIFISYRRDDSSGHTGRLLDSLQQRFGKANVFRDLEDLEPGVDFVAALEKALSESDVMLVIIGSGWTSASGPMGRRLEQQDDIVRIEVGTALGRDEVRVIPVLVAQAKMPEAKDLPDELRPLVRRNAIELTDMRWEYDVGRLGDTLAKYVDQASTSRKYGLPGRLPLVAAVVIALTIIAGFWFRPHVNDQTVPPVMDQPNSLVTAEDCGQKFTGEPLSLNFGDVAPADFFGLMGDYVGWNVVVDPDVTDPIDVELRNVPPDCAIETVVNMYHLAYTVSGPNILRISRVDTLVKQGKAKAELAELQKRSR